MTWCDELWKSWEELQKSNQVASIVKDTDAKLATVKLANSKGQGKGLDK